MAISKDHGKKQPSQSPTAFYQLKQQGGARGEKGGGVPDKLSGGPMREKLMGGDKK